MKKQIEEMTNVLKEHTKKNNIMASVVILEDYAEVLYNAGYRKQEWISVEDELPKNGMARVLVFLRSADITDGIGSPKIDTDRFIDGKWVRWSKYVTHWMPLLSAPSEDGDA